MDDRYDAGLLNDFGGGNVGWWQDYIRAELERAHDFYSTALSGWALGAANATLCALPDIITQSQALAAW